MALRVVWTRKALTDLREIFDFISRDSSFYAQIEVERLQATAARAGELPHAGRTLPEFPDRPWRQLRSGSHRLIYRVEESRILVLAVIHNRRELQAAMVTGD